MDWHDPQPIAIALCERHPQTDPRTVRYTDLHRWVIELEGFQGDPPRSNERLLEAIQMAWIEEAT